MCVCVFSLLFRPTRAVYRTVLLRGVMSRAPKSGGPCAWAVNLAKQMDIHPVPTVTPFRKRVLQLLQTVPEGASHDGGTHRLVWLCVFSWCHCPVWRLPGKVTTYKHMAAKLRCGSCQAIGQALKNNPFAPVRPLHARGVVCNCVAKGQASQLWPHDVVCQVVPCHRVVSASFGIGGFSGFTDPESTKIKKKVQLLREEGVSFERKGNGKWVMSSSPDQALFTFDLPSDVHASKGQHGGSGSGGSGSRKKKAASARAKRPATESGMTPFTVAARRMAKRRRAGGEVASCVSVPS